MLCDKCKTNTATIHYHQTINGRITSLNLCSECATKGGYIHPFGFNAMDLDDFIASVFNVEKPDNHNVKKCPECGYTIERFNKTSLLGCERCYESFRSHLTPIIKNIHGSLQHLDVNTVLTDRNTSDVLSKLKAELSEAVKREEYELAATLRDKIKELEKERQGG